MAQEKKAVKEKNGSTSFSKLAACDPEGSGFPDYERLQGIYDIGRRILGMTDIDSLLETVVELIRKALPLEHCLIADFSGEGGILVPRKHNIEDLPDDFDQWPVSRSVIREVRKTGEAILGIDVSQDETLKKGQFHSLKAKGIKSVVCAPLGTRKACTGVVYVDSSLKKGAHFTEGDLKFLTALSPYIHLAMINAANMAEERGKRKRIEERYVKLKEELIGNHIVGASEALLRAFDRLKRAAKSDVVILLLGERGTGKELFARATHKLSDREGEEPLALNVAALPKGLVESELFGYEKGAFAGAHHSKPGLMELAHGGTLFLDEIGDMALGLQAKILRAVEYGTFRRLGGRKEMKSDFRLVCATNKNLLQMVERGDFRGDLYDRISDITIQIPPLRDRLEDIPTLVAHFLEKLSSKKVFTDSALDYLRTLSWDGNVRVLYKLVKRVDVLCDRGRIEAVDLRELAEQDGSGEARGVSGQAFPTLKDPERDHIEKALEKTKGQTDRVGRAAGLLGIARSTLYTKVKDYGIEI